MKYFNNVKIRVFSGSDDSKSKEGLIFLLPDSLKKIPIQTTNAQGLEDREIKINEIIIEKQHQVLEFMKHLVSNISLEDKELIKSQINSRVDEYCHFFLRFDKDELLNNKYVLTDGGNCFHITVSIAAYPAKAEVARKVILQFLE